MYFDALMIKTNKLPNAKPKKTVDLAALGAELSPWAAAQLQVDPGESGGGWVHGRDDDAHMDARLSTCIDHGLDMFGQHFALLFMCICVYFIIVLNFKDWIHGVDVDLGTVWT